MTAATEPTAHQPADPPSAVRLRDGTDVSIRPVHSHDEPALVQLHLGLSDWTVRHRYHEPVPLSSRIASTRLTKICNPNPTQEVVLVAECAFSDGQVAIIGVARLNRIPGGDDAECAVVVTDRWQRKGLGGALMDRLIAAAEHQMIHRIVAHFERDSRVVRLLCESRNFRIHESDGQALFSADLRLR